jgi:hypothetical protein
VQANPKESKKKSLHFGGVHPRTDKNEGRIAAKYRAVKGKHQLGALPLAACTLSSALRSTNVYYYDDSNSK